MSEISGIGNSDSIDVARKHDPPVATKILDVVVATPSKVNHIVIRVRKDVLKSDDAIVEVLQHEMHELTSLKELVDERGGVPAREIRGLVVPGRRNNLHDQAWDVADLRVRVMRAQPGSPERRALEQSLIGLEDRLRSTNLGGGPR